VDEVQRGVAVGVLKPGESLPSARQLAGELRLNPNTVQHAYRTLKQEGVIETRRGLGAFVSAVPRESRRASSTIARQIAERALREAFRNGLLASDLLRALAEVAPVNSQLLTFQLPTDSQDAASRTPKTRNEE
jgi:GntR family transcriptional regulator